MGSSHASPATCLAVPPGRTSGRPLKWAAGPVRVRHWQIRVMTMIIWASDTNTDKNHFKFNVAGGDPVA